MPFKILCNCGVNLLATDNLASFKVVCPECGGAVNLPKVPDPYSLPTNAEMITIDTADAGHLSSSRLKGATARRRAPARGVPGGRRVEEDGNSVNTTLIVVLIFVGLVIVALSANLFFA